MEDAGKPYKRAPAGRQAQPDEEKFCLYTEADWERIFNAMTDMVTIHDADFNIVCANRAAEKILGLPMLNVERVKCFEYYHGTQCPPEGCPSCACLKTGEPAAFETYEPHLKAFIEIRAIPRKDEDGKVIGLIHIVRDITRRKRAEDSLMEHQRRLEDMVRERTEELQETNERLRMEAEERKLVEKDREDLIVELQEALENIKTLRGLIPICAWCKKIRDDKGYWQQLEVFIKEHSYADFTHGICQECMDRIDASEGEEG